MEISPDAWFTIAVVALCFAALVTNRIGADIVMSGGLTLLLVTGVLSTQEALSGLANEGMVTVAVLYVVVTGLRESGVIEWVVQAVLGRPRSLGGAQLRMMSPVAALSAFLNNTPVVALFIPAVQVWARRYRLSVSRLMIPLSYAGIAGGLCTLIGTSTNLVVNGLLRDQTNLPGLGLFDLAWVGVPVVATVMVFTVLTSRWLLSERRPVLSQLADAREYTVEMLVESGGPLVGRRIDEAGLRQLHGLYLAEIEREGRMLPAVGPHEQLRPDDRLVFVGVVESVVDLQRIRGLKPATDQVFKLDALGEDRILTEAVVSDSSPLNGKSIREGRFRTLYNAAVIAVARNGERVDKKVGDIVLRPGDTLLLISNPYFVEQQRNSRDFYLVSSLEGAQPPRHERAPVATAILIGMVMAATTGSLSMLEAAMLAAGFMLITRCTTGALARRAVDWRVLVVIAASLGIGGALQKTGAAHAIADALVSSAGQEPRAALALVFLATALFSAFVTNNAAAVLMFPIALATAAGMGVNFMPFAVVIMVAASASFTTPIGYQTNLMVYGVGAYRFSDYVRIGLPLTVIVGVVALFIVPIVWPL